MKDKQLEEWVLESKEDKQKLNDLLEAYKPFIVSCTKKVSGRILRFGSDDELSVAMMAFTQAVEKFNPGHGEFLSFAGVIIRSRVLDFYRNQKRNTGRVVYLQHSEDETENPAEVRASMYVYIEERTRQERLQEIYLLKETLSRYDIRFQELERSSPKNKQTRKVCRDIISYIYQHSAIKNEVLQKKLLPLSRIENTLGIKRKRFERHRKYIIAALIIKTGNYPYLQEYVNHL